MPTERQNCEHQKHLASLEPMRTEPAMLAPQLPQRELGAYQFNGGSGHAQKELPALPKCP
jgi:hypothetical protein